MRWFRSSPGRELITARPTHHLLRYDRPRSGTIQSMGDRCDHFGDRLWKNTIQQISLHEVTQEEREFFELTTQIEKPWKPWIVETYSWNQISWFVHFRHQSNDISIPRWFLHNLIHNLSQSDAGGTRDLRADDSYRKTVKTLGSWYLFLESNFWVWRNIRSPDLQPPWGLPGQKSYRVPLRSGIKDQSYCT